MVKILNKKFMLLFMIVVIDSAASGEVKESTMGTIYSGAAAGLEKAKKAAAHVYGTLFSDEKKEDQASYAWIEKLLAILSGVKEEVASVARYDYDAIVKQLHKEFTQVRALELTILSSLADTAMPYHITRNWIKYGALMMASHYAYYSP